MRERFAQLLNELSVLAAQDRSSFGPHVAQLCNLLDGFGAHRGRAVAIERERAARDQKRIDALLADYDKTIESYRRNQEQFADDFNLLDVMNLTGKEIRHSMMLAWLLDHDLRKLGTHAQGNLGFRLFLAEFDLPGHYADCKYWVGREVAGDESIVDIEIACRGKFIIHIENKIWSSEGPDQTDREWSDLQRRAVELNVGAPDIHALFLTPQGTIPANSHFLPIRWGRVVCVLEKFAGQATPPDVKLFARHYAKALRRFIVVQNRSESDNGE